MGRLKALGDARVEALREGILRAGLEQGLIWERLKELGWDSMEEHQATLTSIKSSLEVKRLLACLTTYGIHSCTPSVSAADMPIVPVSHTCLSASS